MDQLDTKKKIRPKLGEGILLRLRFTPSSGGAAAGGGVTAAGAVGGKGYALVTTGSAADEADALGAASSALDNAEVGVELTSKVSATATKDANLEDTEEAFTNLVVGKK